MAKTKSHTDLASTATSSTSHVYASGGRTHSSRRQAHTPVIGPSSTLLALLATVAASSSSADGRPLSPDAQPPDFLCPFLTPQYSVGHSHQRRDEPSDDTQPGDNQITSSSTRVRRLARSTGYVPDKFVQGDDGRWRKEHSWSLYGSSYCECTDNVSTRPETAAPEVDDQVDPTQIASPVTSTVQTTPTDMSTKLPPGWTTQHTSKKDPVSSLILALSIVLAVVICVLIFGCVVWRRKWIPRHKDVEKRSRRKQAATDDGSDSESEEKRRVRSQQRIWAKASARWKSNVRLSVRRRRKRTAATSSTIDAASDVPSSSDIPHSRSSLTLPSTHSSPATAPTDLPTASVALPKPSPADGESPRADEQTSNAGASCGAPGPQQPPDYGESGASQEARAHTADIAQRLLSEPGTSTEAYAASPPSVAPPSSDDPQSHRAAFAAHVATDDKTLLARMANFVSAPPSEDPSSDDLARTSGGPSVPVIEELEPSPEDLQALQCDAAGSSETAWSGSLSPSHRPTLSVQLPVPTYSREPSPHPLFPPPPSKVPLAAPLFYEYPSMFEEDVLDTEPPMGPSAPPFDYTTTPSAPEDDSGVGAVACAPPLIDEEEETILGLGHAHVPSLSEDTRAAVARDDATPSSSHNPPDYLP